MAVAEFDDIFSTPPPLAEVIYDAVQVGPPHPILFTEYCGKFVCDRHDETQGDVGPLGLHIFENCLVGPAGVILSSERRLYDAPDLLSRFWRDTILKKAVNRSTNDLLGKLLSHAPGTEMRRIDGVTLVSLVKPGYLVYGHWLLDILPMAWLFRQSVMARTEAVKFLIGARTPVWARKMMEVLFNLQDQDFIMFDDAHEVLHVERLIQPSLVRRSPLLGPAFNDFVENILSICSKRGDTSADFPKRFYISRIGVNSTAPLTRETVEPQALEAVAVANGLTIVHPEQLAWVDQVKMLAQAELIVGEFGSGLHNSVFADSRSITVAFGNSVMSWTQSAIAATRCQRLQYFMPQSQTQENNRVLIHYDPKSLSACLEQISKLL